MLKHKPTVSEFQALEGRRLLSASLLSAFHHDDRGGFGGPGGSEIDFSLAPAAVKTGLTSLASTDGYTAPTDTTEVYLGNRKGVETYSIRESSTGTSSVITVDSAGNAVTAPTKSTTTFGAISDSAVTNEFNALATAISATAPASAHSVTVSTPTSGLATYTLGLVTTNSKGKTHTTRYTVDADGNVTGNTRVPLSVLTTAVQTGLTSNAPSGATALASTSLVNVRVVDGVTLYSVTYKATGIHETVSVNTSGALAGSTTSEITFADLDSTVSSEIQTLATAKGITDTIDTTTKVTKTVEANGTVLYTIRLAGSTASDSDRTFPVVITVDSAGNPTVLADNFAFGGFRGGRGHGRR